SVIEPKCTIISPTPVCPHGSTQDGIWGADPRSGGAFRRGVRRPPLGDVPAGTVADCGRRTGPGAGIPADQRGAGGVRRLVFRVASPSRLAERGPLCLALGGD